MPEQLAQSSLKQRLFAPSQVDIRRHIPRHSVSQWTYSIGSLTTQSSTYDFPAREENRQSLYNLHLIDQSFYRGGPSAGSTNTIEQGSELNRTDLGSRKWLVLAEVKGLLENGELHKAQQLLRREMDAGQKIEEPLLGLSRAIFPARVMTLSTIASSPHFRN